MCEFVETAMVKRYFSLGYLCLLLLAFAIGCGSKATTYPAGGKVVHADGKPVSNGSVTFRSQAGERPVTARGPLQQDGTFKLTTFASNDGAVAGKHQALVSVTVVEGDFSPPRIDPRYTHFETSGLEFTVTTDPVQNDFLIQVTPPER
jgi:hypothetical protein